MEFTLSTIQYWAGFITNVTVAFAAIAALITFLYQTITGGFRGLRFFKKFNGFIDRVDCIVDDYFPEVLSAMEKKGLISIGASAKWTSQQAKILKSASPIHITDFGNNILREIGFEADYDQNASRVKEEVLKLLPNSAAEYDLEQVCLRLAQTLFDENDPLSRNAKEYLFNHPQMSTAEMQSLMGIYLRDKMKRDPAIAARLR